MSDEPQRPTSNDDREGWKAYWSAQRMPWRTEPEIDEERQGYLAKRRAVTPDIEKGIYPFRDENGSIKLTRADVEWLLATHETNGVSGPMDWDDVLQRRHFGIDLRGSDLRDENLRDLPLAGTRFGLSLYELPLEQGARVMSPEQWEMAAAHVERAVFQSSRMERAQCRGTHFEHSDLRGVNLYRAGLWYAHVQQADLRRAHLEDAFLQGANLSGTHMELAFFDAGTYLQDVRLSSEAGGYTFLADAQWANVNMSVVDFSRLPKTGEEWEARKPQDRAGARKPASQVTAEYQDAVRAARQLASALRSQGINEHADYYAYRAHRLQRVVLRRQYKFLRWVWSWFLEILAGYGYEPIRTLGLYIGIVLAFASIYQRLAPGAHLRLTFLGALVMSVASFHGRGFFPTPVSP
jgi:uncharacterized protein YjbI with pentapeptide repeats